MSHSDDYKNPLPNTKTLTMTVPGILQWLDLEVEFIKENYKKEADSIVQLVLMGTWLHLEVMKEQLINYSLDSLDNDQ